jgi:hypothetical protein
MIHNQEQRKIKGKLQEGVQIKWESIARIPRTVENTRIVHKGEMKYKNTKRTIVVSLISNSKHCQVINGWVIPLQEKFPRKRNVIISPKSEG